MVLKVFSRKKRAIPEFKAAGSLALIKPGLLSVIALLQAKRVFLRGYI